MKSLVAALCAGVSFAGMAHADDMFSGIVAAASDDGATTFEFSRLDTSVMQMQPGETVTLNFGAGYEAELDRIDTQALGARSWVGRLEGEGLLGRIIITETNGIVFGRIATPEGLWYVIPEGRGHRIMQMPEGLERRYRVDDTIRITPEAIAAAMEESGEEPPVGEAVAVGSNGIVDVAVFYSQSFATQWGMTSGARVQHLVAVLDTALVDSDTGMRARLVYTGPVTLTDDNADQAQTLTNLSGLTSGEAPTVTQDLSALRAYRTSHGADLIGILQLTQGGHGGCGIANILGAPATNGDINASWAAQGYSVTGDWYGGGGFCSDITYAHEVGHNLGMAHNVEDAGGVGTGVRTFAHGHRQDCDFITIMAYPTNGGNCPNGAPRTIGNEMEATWFSNPSLNLCPNGQACGIAAAGEVSGVLTNDPADNARAAREESKDVVLFSAEVPRLVSSVLPTTRTVQNGSTATAFMTVINPASSGSNATNCGLRLGGATPAQFSFQTTDPSTNQPTGAVNDATNTIGAGNALTFVFSVTSAATFDDNTGLTNPSANDERNLFVEAYCDNRRSAEYTLGLNTLTFVSSPTPIPDVIALAATIGNSGRVQVPLSGNQVGVFSVAVSNIGASGSITATPDLGGRTIAGVNTLEICRTDPGTGACTTPRAASQTLTLNQNDTATFGIFVRGNGQQILFNPSVDRVFVRFNEGANPRGATSVAVQTVN